LQIAALEKRCHAVVDYWSPESVLGLITLVIDLAERVEMLIQQLPQVGLPRSKAESEARHRTSIELLNELRRCGIAGGIYTQTTDVEGEINGMMTYDRKVIKIPAEQRAHLHRQLFEP
jgi:hypothetical protein